METAVKRSTLPAPSRLLIHTLLTHVTNGTLKVPAEFAPSLTTLVQETGLGRGTVAEHLNRLEADGWLKRTRPTTREALKQHARTGYTISAPVRLLDQSESRTSPGAGRGDEKPQDTTSPRAGLVREPDGTSPRAGHNPMSFPTSSSPTEKKTEGGVGGTTIRTKANSEHPDFAAWYAEYPAKKQRGQAVKAFPKALAKAGGDVQVLIDGVKRYRTTDKVRRGYIQNPATWLNGECWLDEPELAATGTDGVPGHGPRARVNDQWTNGQGIEL
ncbi:hypothetical protein [Actinoallomurus sp. CA-142502]|uniref:hypothetical protein n=1 Tax=Actinoallomurus sp. CA-142502 TaxID=3239885 RepID=UPI003D94F903